jgi:hypothetical protein
LYLPERALYDAVRPVFTTRPDVPAEPGAVSASPVYSLLSPLIPIQDSFTVSIHPPTPLPDEETGKYVIFERGVGSPHVSRATWNKGWASAQLRDLGTFRLLRDDSPPSITPLGFKDGARVAGSSISVVVRDNLGSIRSFRAELDGKWLMFSYKGNTYTYSFDEHFPQGQHVLVISVSDEAGNTTERTYNLTR